MTLAVFDLTGRLVRVLERGERDAGVHRISWDGRDQSGAHASDGVYFYRVQTPDATRSLKVALLH